MSLDMFESVEFKNPFRPGAGHMPPYLAGRETEQNEFQKLVEQDVILENMILTGLRGVGKTVLLETFKPIALEKKWLWLNADLSEAASINEENIAKRLLTDLSIKTSSLIISKADAQKIGFDKIPRAESEKPYTPGGKHHSEQYLDYETLVGIFSTTPGLIADKLKSCIEIAWTLLTEQTDTKGIVFAYDEAQNLADHSDRAEYPLSLLLDVFQSIQRKGLPCLLVLTGLPTLYSKLIEARTYSERMFHVLELLRLNVKDSRDAIIIPIKQKDCPITFDDASITLVAESSGGYPYFIQFICREIYDIWIQKMTRGEKPSVPIAEIIQKLDTDFFSARWSRVTDRQRDLLLVAANLEDCEIEFTVRAITKQSEKQLEKPLSSSHVNQMLVSLCNAGLVYKNRHGKYSFAVPLLHEYIKRQHSK